MTKPRDYSHEYKIYHSKPEKIKERAQRNAARASVKKKVGAAAIAGKDIDHKKPIRKGGGNGKGNLAIASVHRNRGYEAE